MTEAQYAILLNAQGGVCAICTKPEVRTTGAGKIARLAVDHDHNCCPGRTSCGKCIRGLLCERCNRSIGLFEDSPELLNSAIQYIRRNKENELANSRSRRSGRFSSIFAKANRLVRQG